MLVRNTKTGRIYYSLADAARALDVSVGTCWKYVHNIVKHKNQRLKKRKPFDLEIVDPRSLVKKN